MNYYALTDPPSGPGELLTMLALNDLNEAERLAYITAKLEGHSVYWVATQSGEHWLIKLDTASGVGVVAERVNAAALKAAEL